MSLSAVATNLAVDYNLFSSSITTTLTYRTHVKIFIDDCNYDYCRKQLQKLVIDSYHVIL
jgi:hypothetical protein